jgi:Skp family chaperone for outer membrane proteins
VKRKFGIITGIAALALAVYVASLWAQNTQGRGPALQTKVAVVNLPMVIKNYDKYKNYEKDLKEFAEGYQKKEEAIKAEMTKLRVDDKLSVEEKEQQAKRCQRDLEDLGLQFKKEIAKKQEAQLVTLYQEVEDMVKRVAETYNFEMVLQYSDAPDPKDRNTAMNILRKVQGGMCGPMYAASGLDISQMVYYNLNRLYNNNSAKAAPAH